MKQPAPIPFEIHHGDWTITGFVMPGRKPSDRERREAPEVVMGMVASEETETIEAFDDWLGAQAGHHRRILGELTDKAIEAVADKLPRDLPFEPEWDDNGKRGER